MMYLVSTGTVLPYLGTKQMLQSMQHYLVIHLTHNLTGAYLYTPVLIMICKY